MNWITNQQLPMIKRSKQQRLFWVKPSKQSSRSSTRQSLTSREQTNLNYIKRCNRVKIQQHNGDPNQTNLQTGSVEKMDTEPPEQKLDLEQPTATVDDTREPTCWVEHPPPPRSLKTKRNTAELSSKRIDEPYPAPTARVLDNPHGPQTQRGEGWRRREATRAPPK
jgi:hypothetical protein